MSSEHDGGDEQLPKPHDDDEDSVSSEESSEDELALDGELVRNPDVASASDGDDDDDDVEADAKRPAVDEGKDPSRKRKKRKEETLQVEFIFCDMAEKYFHGLKNLLHSSSALYQQHSSNLADLMIQNVSVGTVVSTTSDSGSDASGDVFGFASVLNVTTFQKAAGVQFLKGACFDHCPKERKDELEVILSGSTKRPAGFLLQGRMLNLPLEMVLTLHQQLVQDIDWAVQNAGGGKEEQKSLDFGLILRLAPCQREDSSIVYKYFDDEILADRAEFTFQFTFPPKGDESSAGETGRQLELVTAMVLTKNGHRLAIEDIGKMVNS